MKTIVLFDPKPNEVPAPIRRLQDGPDYRPDWRFLAVERYISEIGEAADKSAETDVILAREKDPFVRQLLRFHCARTCVIAGPILYALRCHATNAENRAESVIKAMVVAGRTAQQIAADLGTDASNVVAFEKIYFDVRRYLDKSAWLAQLCHSVRHNPTEVEMCEARWMTIAFHGWARLAPYLTQPRQPLSATPQTAVNHLLHHLLFRSLDFVISLETRGIPPSERDLQMLAVLQQRFEGLSLPLPPRDIDFAAPLGPEQKKKVAESELDVTGVSAVSRRKIANFIEQLVAKSGAS
jgi:hypothetical protein